jgi:hypothetical protein
MILSSGTFFTDTTHLKTCSRHSLRELSLGSRV